MSKKRLEQMPAEIEVRKKLAERCGGVYVPKFNNAGREIIGFCQQGLCEKCWNPPDWRGLHPHESPFRSQGGKVSLEQSKMLCGRCHSTEHHIREASNA